MAGGKAIAHEGEEIAEGIIAKAAKDSLRDAEGAVGKDAARTATRDVTRDAAGDVTTKAADDVASTTAHTFTHDAEHAANDLPISDGEFRSLDQQIHDPQVHPHNADIVEPDYDPLAGSKSPEDFLDQHWNEKGGWDGNGDWKWPDHDGKVPGSESYADPSTMEDLDRIGGPRGSYFSPENTPFGERAIPPDRLNFDRRGFGIDPSSPHFSGENPVVIERSRIAPAFGQDGGGIQYRFGHMVNGKLEPLSTDDLLKLKIITQKWGNPF